MTTEHLITLVIGIFGGGGFVSLITAILKRRWDRQDSNNKTLQQTEGNTTEINKINSKLDEIRASQAANSATQGIMMRALKVSLAHSIRYIGSSCIYAKGITLKNKETLDEMYAAYEALPTKNGLCDTVMEAVDKLPIIEGWEEKLNKGDIKL